MKLSDFGLCKPLDCSSLPAIQENEALPDDQKPDACNNGGTLPENNGNHWESSDEQLQHWQINRRKLVLILQDSLYKVENWKTIREIVQ